VLAKCEVYDDSGTLLARTYFAFATTVSLDLIRIGLVPAVNSSSFTEGAQDHDIDSMVITRITSWDEADVEIGGTVSGPYLPDANGNTGATWTGQGDATNLDNNIDEGTPIDNTDYNYFTGATATEQSYDIANYGGANVPTKVAAFFAHRQDAAGGINDVFFRAGFDDGSGNVFDEGNDVLAGGSTVKYSIRVAQDYNGTAFTTSNFDSLEIQMRKRLDLPNNDKRHTYSSVEILEDDGFTPQADPVTTYNVTQIS
jgi:hypothetical protein